jgi:uncharacterized repeat protein (TIGR01451 family)
VSILFANGDGTFTRAAAAPAVGINPGLIAAGDFNGDGQLDLVVVNNCGNDASCNSGGTISILLGDGSGNFTAAPQFPLPIGFSDSIVMGDFNNDGKLDFAIQNQSNSSNVNVFLGNGDGTFTVKAVADTGGFAASTFVTGDFNADGNLDFAIQECLGDTLRCVWGFAILSGDGAGNFTPAASYSIPNAGLGPTPPSLVAGDFSGDGILDLAVLSRDGVIVYRGNGDGTFSGLPPTPTGNDDQQSLIASGDFNGDGNLDLVLSDAGRQAVKILLGDGAGNFPAISSRSEETPASYMVVGDFNGDGRLDLEVGDVYSTDSAFLLLQAPDLTLSKTHTGNFTQGQTGVTYTITATNSGSVTTTGMVTASDVLPLGLTATAMSGTGWDCSANSFPVSGNGTAMASCTRSDALAPGASYPPITLVANVAANAPESLTNTATVSDGGDGNPSNNSANDPTTIVTYNVYVPASMAFLDQLVGSTGAPQTATLTMSGTGTLDISSIAVSGDFAQTNDCGSTLGPATTCTITITFTPTATGTRTGFITVSDNAPNSPQTIALTGTGIQPAVTLSPASLAFGNQFVGNVGLPQNFSVTNSGTSPLNISSVVASSSYGDSVGCTSPIPPGSTCSISVFFDPASSGSITGTLTITDDAPGSPHTVTLSGTGQDFTLAATSSSSTTANIAQGLTANFVLSLAPSGGFSQPVSFTCSGAPLKSACTVNPAVVTLSSINPTAIMVSVTTTASSLGLPQSLPPSPTILGAPPFIAWWMAFILAVGLVAFARRARGRVPPRLAMGTAVLLVTMLGAFGMPGCGGGTMPTAIHTAGTPAGTYTLNVTGTFASGTDTLSHSVQLTLTVH